MPPSTTTYHEAAHGFRAELAAVIPKEELKALHVTSGWRHALVAVRQLVVLAAAVAAVLAGPDLWYVWLPASIAIGFVVFSGTVLFHEVLHRTVFSERSSRWNGVLGLLYTVPSGLSAAQFTKWHLDHHDHLGTEDLDPKRHHLTPKIVRRWYKALYLTPVLFPIYFRAAAREATGYPPALRRTIGRQRILTMAFHVGLLAALVAVFGPMTAAKLHAIPVFLVFPVAFTINRLGQHYDIRPDDPALWGTVLKPSVAWDWVFLWSGYHLEHHYFPRVPFYRLPRLRRDLAPFFAARGVRQRTYSGLLYDWFVLNKTPHTDWSRVP